MGFNKLKNYKITCNFTKTNYRFEICQIISFKQLHRPLLYNNKSNYETTNKKLF